MARYIIDSLQKDEKIITVDRTSMEHAPGFAGSVQLTIHDKEMPSDMCVHLGDAQVDELIEALQAHQVINRRGMA